MIHMQSYVFLMLLKVFNVMWKYLIYCQELIKQDISNRIKLVNVNAD